MRKPFAAMIALWYAHPLIRCAGGSLLLRKSLVRRLCTGVLILAVLLPALSPHTSAGLPARLQGNRASSFDKWAEGTTNRIAVQVKPGVPGITIGSKGALESSAAIVAALNRYRPLLAEKMFLETQGPLSYWYLVELPDAATALQAAAYLRGIEDIETVDTCSVTSVDWSPPNDPLFWEQWNLFAVSAGLAWDAFQPTRAAVVAVIDTGVDYGHVDLAANFWHNPGEIPGNGQDDDDNGKVDDVIGWDFVYEGPPSGYTPIDSEDYTQPDNQPLDFHGHGTGVAGIIAAATDNGQGIAGLAPSTEIMALRAGYAALDTQGRRRGLIDFCAAAQAINYAAAPKADGSRADVINMSFGQYYDLPDCLAQAVEAAYQSGVILVASAGNDDQETTYHYPSSLDEVIAVGATTMSDTRASGYHCGTTWGSNFGWPLEVVAPGIYIPTTKPNQQYYDDANPFCGTSAAAPHVAAVAAMLRATQPSLSPEQVRQVLAQTADKVGGYLYSESRPYGSWNQEMGYGLVNAYRALKAITPTPPPPPPPPPTDSATFVSDITLPDGTVVSPGQALNKVWRVRNSGTSTWGSGYQLVFVGGDQMGAPSAVDVPGTVSPNATVDLSVDMTAPSNSDHYVGHWRLRNAQNVYFGDELWIDVVVQGDPQEGDITVLSVNYPSVVAPGEQFRPEIRVRVNTGALLESRGDMLRNTDGNLYGAWPHVAVVGTVNTGQEYTFRFYEDNPITAPSSLGTYESRWRVWQDGRYVGPEIVIRFEVQPSGSLNHPPNPPTLVDPPDYHVSETGAPTLRAQHNGDPDGDSITAYYFEIFDSHDNPNSGWISQNSWTPPGLGLYGYKWHAKVRDSRGAESGWSETRHFLIEDPGPQIYDFHWEWCRPAWGGPEKICFCADTNAGTLRVQVNMATDGSENGEWKIINELGVPQYMCSSDDDRPPNWAQLEAETGTHLARLYARREGGWEAAATADLLIYLPPDRRPNSPYGQHPSAGAYVDSQTVRFEWLKTLRTTDYHLVAGTTPDLSQNLLLDVHLPADTPEYTHTFDDDYSTIYWEVTSTGPYGTNEASSHFHIDVDPPASAVNALPAVMTEAVFPVNWGGSDAGSGLHWYDVQFRDGERGEWVTWMAETTATGALFRGEPGHTYYFRGRAMDEVGNWEAYPGGDGDTHTLVDPTAAPPTEWWNQDYAYKRNVIVLNNDSHTLPSGYPVRLYFDASTTPTAEELYNASQSPNKGDDFRVIYDNATELDRYVRRFGPSEIDIWFQTQASVSSTASDDSYQIYYGNPSPGSPPGDITTVMVPPNDANTIGLWHLQEEEGSTAHDGSGHGHDGTLVNSPAWSADGKWGSCLHFDGIDGQHIDLGNSSVWDLDTFTIEAWVYPEQASGRIVSRAKQPGTSDPILYTLEMKNWKPFYWSEDGGGTIWSPSTIPANKWAHLAATRDGSRSKLFVNGVEVGSLPHGSWDDTANGSLILAGRLQGCYQGFRVSNVARSSFPYGEFAQITDEPSVAAGDAIAQPSPGTPDLAVQSLATYPTTSGGVIVQAVVRNEGNASTTNGFYTDLYADHKPTGAGDYTGSVRFWIASPIEPGATVTLTTVLTDVTGAGGLSAAALGPLSETSVTLYTQADSSGVVRETDNLDNISTGLDVCIANPDAYENAATSSNLLINGSFEDGSYAPDAAPAAWTQDAWNWSASTFIWDDAQAHDGNRSVRITNDDFNDARWAQTVTVEPNTDYRLSGWIKTENVAHTQESIDAGANLSVFDSPEFRIWTYVGELFGTNDWTYVSLVFNSGDVTELTIAARLGYWYGTTTGTAWFDDIRLEPLYASPPGDDIPANAQPIALDETQRRNFDRLGDQDWVRFTAQGGMTYTIQTSNLGLAADTYLYLYDTDGSTLLAANDDYGGSLASQLEWAAPATGDYYILVKHWNPNVGGCGTAYDLTVMRALTNKLFLPIILKNR